MFIFSIIILALAIFLWRAGNKTNSYNSDIAKGYAILAALVFFLCIGNSFAQTAQEVDSISSYVTTKMHLIDGGAHPVRIKVHDLNDLGKENSYSLLNAELVSGRTKMAEFYIHSSGKTVVVNHFPGIYFGITSFCLWDPDGNHRVLHFHGVPTETETNYFVTGLIFKSAEELHELLIILSRPKQEISPFISTILFKEEKLKANSNGTLMQDYDNDYLVNMALFESFKILADGI